MDNKFIEYMSNYCEETLDDDDNYNFLLNKYNERIEEDCYYDNVFNLNKFKINYKNNYAF